jgi:hypothetical protein
VVYDELHTVFEGLSSTLGAPLGREHLSTDPQTDLRLVRRLARCSPTEQWVPMFSVDHPSRYVEMLAEFPEPPVEVRLIPTERRCQVEANLTHRGRIRASTVQKTVEQSLCGVGDERL